MIRQLLNLMVFLTVALSLPQAAPAATIMITGTRANVNSINPPGTGRCAPLNTVNISPVALSSTGTSNLGAFTSTQSHCIPGAPSAAAPFQPITAGIFTYDFGSGNTLAGVYTGTATFANNAASAVENLIVQGGTGVFAGATGFINTTGFLGFGPNPNGAGMVGIYSGLLSGQLNIPAIPEPATWAMMMLGFGLIGGAIRVRRGIAVVA